MSLGSYLKLFFVLIVLSACAKSEPPVMATETVVSPEPSPTESVMPTAQPPGSQIDLASLSGKIVYSSEGDIFVVNADGSGRAQVTDNPAADFDPVWSPDGTQIAFRSHRDNDEEVYLMNADGSYQRNLSNGPAGGDYSPAWSPNGEWIAFMSNRAGNNNIWVIQPDGSGLRQVTDISGISEYPTWAPDSSQIAFNCTFGRSLSTGSGDFEICVVNFDGTELIQLTDTPGSNKFPAWSPDGTRLAFESDRDGWPTLPDYEPLGYDPGDFGDSEIYIMNIDGSEQVNLTKNPREGDTFPAWSRDGHLVFSRYGCLMVMNDDGSGVVQIVNCLEGGQFPDWYQPITTSGTSVESDNCSIVFVDERNKQVDMYTILSDGTQLKQLTNDAAQERGPVWSPDGTQIAYQNYMDERSIPEIFVMSSDGGGQVNLTNNSGDDRSPAWSPDGTKIVFYSQRAEGPSLYLMNPDGSALTKIPETGFAAGPGWSPDGTQIVYRKELPGNDEIFIINTDGTNPLNLTNYPANDHSPDWSPDGRMVVFESIRDGNSYELYSVDSAGNQLLRLTSNQVDDQHARWSPDGTAILFTHHGELYLMNPDGSNPRSLGTKPVSGQFADWGPCEK